MSVPVLSAHRISTPASSSIADDRLFAGEQARAHRHRHGEHRRHGDRNGRDGQHERELKGREHRIAAIDPEADDHGHEGQGQEDKVVADFQHRLLEVADAVRTFDQLGRLTEVGI